MQKKLINAFAGAVMAGASILTPSLAAADDAFDYRAPTPQDCIDDMSREDIHTEDYIFARTGQGVVIHKFAYQQLPEQYVDEVMEDQGVTREQALTPVFTGCVLHQTNNAQDRVLFNHNLADPKGLSHFIDNLNNAEQRDVAQRNRLGLPQQEFNEPRAVIPPVFPGM